MNKNQIRGEKWKKSFRNNKKTINNYRTIWFSYIKSIFPQEKNEKKKNCYFFVSITACYTKIKQRIETYRAVMSTGQV